MTNSKDIVLAFDVEYYDYLDELRRSGVTNMWGARAYLIDEFSIEDKVFAGQILTNWMNTFEARRKQGVTGD